MSIERKHIGDRMSQIVIHNDTIYLAGQVGEPGQDITEQTESIVAKIAKLLEEVGSDKTKILQAIVWVDDIAHVPAMNAVWDAWVPKGHAPARACGESKLVAPDYNVEITVIAAK